MKKLARENAELWRLLVREKERAFALLEEVRELESLLAKSKRFLSEPPPKKP